MPRADTPARRRDALQVVARAIAIDTAGDGQGPSAALNSITMWKHCDWVRSTDFVVPVTTSRILTSAVRGDSLFASVVYRTLGIDPGGSSEFKEKVGWDTIGFTVAPDRHGHLKIQCGDYHLNHPGITAFRRNWMPFRDSTSIIQWARALRDGGPPN
jgi:hypothetical protein